MTGGALAAGVEDLFPAAGSILVEGTGRRLWRRNGQLVEVQVGELGCDDVGLATGVSGAALCRNRILLLVVQPGVVERSRAVHLGGGHIRIPPRCSLHRESARAQNFTACIESPGVERVTNLMRCLKRVCVVAR